MRVPMGVVLVALCLWLAIALVVDHYVVSTACPSCTRIAAVTVTLQIPAGSLNLPRVGLALLAGLPLLALALYLVPWRSPGDSAQWGEAFRLWCQPIIWLVVALACAVLGESLYLVSKDHWSQGMRNVARSRRGVTRTSFTASAPTKTASDRSASPRPASPSSRSTLPQPQGGVSPCANHGSRWT